MTPREREESAIAAYRAGHPELIAMARLFGRPEARKALDDIASVKDGDERRAYFMSFFLALAGDPGACAGMALHYMARKLGVARDKEAIDFWLNREKSILAGEAICSDFTRED